LVYTFVEFISPVIAEVMVFTYKSWSKNSSCIFWLETCSWIFDEARSGCLDVKICSGTIYCSAYMFYLTNVLASTSLSN
jgi:hypothetical protein